VRLDGDYVDVRGLMAAAGGTTAEEEAILRRFMPDAPAQRRTLADIIMEKIKEKEEAATEEAGDGAGAGSSSSAAAGGGAPALPPMDPKLVEVYAEVGRYLARYKSGKLPKVLKIVPALGNWEEVLFLTNPETWTPHATFAATRIFASAFNAAKAQRFFNLVLLPKCRDDIALHKRLNFHLYLALKKATYKPAAFYRGVILPLAASGDCTLREAVIFGSVIGKASLPALHSAATLMKLASLWPYAGAVSIFLRLLLNKKYTLAFIAVDAVVDHFMRFMEVEGPLPVIWHQALLALAQRYKADLTRAQKEGLKALMATHAHHVITNEVRRELFSAGCRGEAPSVPAPGVGASSSAAAAPAAAGAGSSSSSSSGGFAGKGKKRPAPGSHSAKTSAAGAAGASGDMLY
jgi:essential nuclear protein 1